MSKISHRETLDWKINQLLDEILVLGSMVELALTKPLDALKQQGLVLARRIYEGDKWLAVSAGIKPAGYVHPKAIQVLTEYNMIHQGKSKLAGQYRDWDFDLVMTVCDSAAEECPIWLGQGVCVHHSFPDQAEATGSEEEILAAFRLVRDAIAKEILELLSQYN